MATTAGHDSHDYSLSDATRRFLARPKQLAIGGNWLDARSGATLDVLDPATEQRIASVPAADAADVDAAVKAARAAFESPAWAQMYPAARERLMIRLAELIEAHADELSQIDSLDNGKPVSMARAIDLNACTHFLRYMAGWATKIRGTTLDLTLPFPNMQHFAYTAKEPIGVVGAIVPWNLPLLMAVLKLGPALATGCTMVLKPAEETPLSALRLAELVEEAGIPAGVFNVVTGYGHIAGAALAAHPGIDKVTFTGSTDVGKQIGKAAVENMTRMSLELGGKSPMIVLQDADVQRAIPGLAFGIFDNQGEVCTAGSRLYVHEKLFDQVVEGVARFASAIKIGPGLHPETQMGPLVSKRQQQRVLGYIESGIADGAQPATANTSRRERGYFVNPTVLTTTRQDIKVVQEEIFGPVLVATPFKDEEQAIAMANATRYGLAASIWSNDLSRVHRMIGRLRAGTVWVNAHNMINPALPFGGYKQSGLGKEMGQDHIESYLQSKSVLMFV
jgi:phenylacetaldehyde dehydrogenase